ncbi:beta-propeller domain-containing protein [Pseudoalteromonas sp. SMS1]|uniref:beta-propeller domain-containing protein n=1 Tax=Pseudoalteromonas sp. SMS1 TaxID=2908894 RepID=UPI001F331305|nr:beta-propeller domain-containing protein [Pseudoalteromonas sp. SMS1]MCF2857646.1 beta-propeller domain-containing protein [Pseudoalteromonas sp. SMS1]
MFYLSNTRQIARSRIFFVVLPALVACGGSNNSEDNPDGGGSNTPNSVPQLTWLSESSSSLRQASSSEFNQLVKNGMYLSRWSSGSDDGTDEVANAAPEADSGSTNFSNTNVQEAGVDEGDRIEYDGNYLYIAGHSDQEMVTQAAFKQYVRVMKRTEQGLEEVKKLAASESLYSHQELYLDGNRLASLFKYPVYSMDNSPLPNDADASVSTSPVVNVYPDTFEVSVADVTSPEQAAVIKQYRFDGNIIDSRVIDGNLYVVSSFNAFFEFSQTDALAAYQALYKADISALLPKVTDLSTGATSALFESNNCYIPTNTTSLDSANRITTITRVSLTDPTQLQSTCINAPTDGIYAAKNSIYLHSRFWPEEEASIEDIAQTALHKFQVSTQGISYSASGSVPGSLGFGGGNFIEPAIIGGVSNPAFRLSEFEGQLRLLTTRFSSTAGLVHQLFVLEQQGNALNTIAKLPNESHPTPIGKVEENGSVEENVYAVRYVGNKAYIVTFRRIDPLYVIDLSNPIEPTIAGALEIPGYSAYLHPVSDALLIGVGQNVDEWFWAAPDSSSSNDEPVVGAKVSLFDVSDMSNPKLINEHIFANGYTPVEFDHHAFSFLNVTDEQFRMTLPIETWLTEQEADGSMVWTNKNELAAFEIRTGSTAALAYLGSSIARYEESAQSVPYVRASDDRGVIHDDTVYYIHGNFVWSSLWQNPAQNSGPF